MLILSGRRIFSSKVRSKQWLPRPGTVPGDRGNKVRQELRVRCDQNSFFLSLVPLSCNVRRRQKVYSVIRHAYRFAVPVCLPYELDRRGLSQ
jgi:hypothetical protein